MKPEYFIIAATVGQRVFVRDGVIEGPAPALPIVTGEV